jgi:hypothetical protein
LALPQTRQAGFGFALASACVLVEELVISAVLNSSTLAATNGVTFPLEKRVSWEAAAAFSAFALAGVTVVEGESSGTLIALRLILLNEEDQSCGGVTISVDDSNC